MLKIHVIISIYHKKKHYFGWSLKIHTWINQEVTGNIQLPVLKIIKSLFGDI